MLAVVIEPADEEILRGRPGCRRKKSMAIVWLPGPNDPEKLNVSAWPAGGCKAVTAVCAAPKLLAIDADDELCVAGSDTLRTGRRPVGPAARCPPARDASCTAVAPEVSNVVPETLAGPLVIWLEVRPYTSLPVRVTGDGWVSWFSTATAPLLCRSLMMVLLVICIFVPGHCAGPPTWMIALVLRFRPLFDDVVLDDDITAVRQVYAVAGGAGGTVKDAAVFDDRVQRAAFDLMADIHGVMEVAAIDRESSDFFQHRDCG